MNLQSQLINLEKEKNQLINFFVIRKARWAKPFFNYISKFLQILYLGQVGHIWLVTILETTRPSSKEVKSHCNVKLPVDLNLEIVLGY